MPTHDSRTFVVDANVLNKQATCVTNEKPLRKACLDAGVAPLWGLELMLELIQTRHLGAKAAISIAVDIRRTNPFITQEIVERFRDKALTKR